MFGNLVNQTVQWYHYLNVELSDEGTRDMWLVSNPGYMLALTVIYVKFVTEWGPHLMENRQPFEMNAAMIIYNVVQIVYNVYVFVLAWQLGWGWGGRFKWICQPIEGPDSPDYTLIRRGVHAYFVLKIIDLMDTVFMVLRKKTHQVTFLHVYHHAGMCLLSWGSVKYLPGGHGSFLGIINAFVHAIMYTYYLVTSLWPEYSKRQLWWKKYLTQLQMIQFFLVGAHTFAPLFVTNCNYPRWIVFLMGPQNIFMFFLFYDFYKKAYFPKEINCKKER